MKEKKKPAEPNLDDLTIVFISDSEGYGGTIYFKELPGIIAEGETYEEAKRNLYKLAKFHFENL